MQERGVGHAVRANGNPPILSHHGCYYWRDRFAWKLETAHLNILWKALILDLSCCPPPFLVSCFLVSPSPDRVWGAGWAVANTQSPSPSGTGCISTKCHWWFATLWSPATSAWFCWPPPHSALLCSSFWTTVGVCVWVCVCVSLCACVCVHVFL